MTDYNDDVNVMLDDFNRLFGNNFETINKKLNTVFSDLMSVLEVRTYGCPTCQDSDGILHMQGPSNTETGQGPFTKYPAETLEEPLCDIQQDRDTVRITLEVPGVAKEDVSLEGAPSSLTVTVNSPKKKFSKIIALPCDVDLDSAEAICNNGILEVAFKTTRSAEIKKKISIG